MTADLAVELRGIQKAFRTGHIRRQTRVALQGLDLDVPRGGIFGYLGPNGSGKTTTIKILMGLVRADAGTIRVLGRAHADSEWKYRTGYLPEHPYFYDYLTPDEYLDYVGRLFGLDRAVRKERAQDLLDRVGLQRSRKVSLRRFSKGMLQRVGIAQALMNDPELVVLDEPMSGLDPLGRRMVRDLILDLRSRGKTVLFSTHILSDAETLCDRIALLRYGQLLKVGRMDEIVTVDIAHMEALVAGVAETVLAGLAGVRARQALGERWRLEMDEDAVVDVLGAVRAGGGRILSLQPVRQSLEDYFVREMKQPDQGTWTLEE